jgi:hypothetical protein
MFVSLLLLLRNVNKATLLYTALACVCASCLSVTAVSGTKTTEWRSYYTKLESICAS